MVEITVLKYDLQLSLKIQKAKYDMKLMFCSFHGNYWKLYHAVAFFNFNLRITCQIVMCTFLKIEMQYQTSWVLVNVFRKLHEIEMNSQMIKKNHGYPIFIPLLSQMKCLACFLFCRTSNAERCNNIFVRKNYQIFLSTRYCQKIVKANEKLFKNIILYFINEGPATLPVFQLKSKIFIIILQDQIYNCYHIEATEPNLYKELKKMQLSRNNFVFLSLT